MMTRLRWKRCTGLFLSLLLGAAAGCDGPPESTVDERSGEPADKQANEPVEQAVGAVCASSKQCAPEEYCATPPGDCDRDGVCTALPAACDRTPDPVCSCDGVEYRNACYAAADKAGVDFAGACPPPSCTSNAQCSASAYCARATGDCLGTGACEARPSICSGVWNPVCGCNNKTYANACKAAQVGIVVKKLGSC